MKVNKSIYLFGLSVIMLFSAFTMSQSDRLYEISKNIEIFVKVYKELNANYVDDIDPNRLMRIGIDAMVGSLDPYTNYFSEAQVESYRISTDGKYEGIGSVVKKIDDYVTIVEPYQGSSVLDAGLQAGDQIISIEGMSTDGKTHEEVTQMFRGVPGTNIRLGINRPVESREFEVVLTRKEVNIPNVPYSGFVDEDIAYVSLSTFTQEAGKNIREAYRDMRNENVNLKGFILDLRDNGGGLLNEAINVSNIFIDKDKEIVSVKSKVRERDITYNTRMLPLDNEIPLVVLINNKSASASEIVSGVIQDYDRGVLIGQRSYGKGLVQNTKDVGYNAQVKLTTSKYYIPSGRCIQSVEYENGEPVNIEDEKRAKFKTKGGRIVLDGGGVSPDVVMEAPATHLFTDELLNQNIIFKYVNNYIEKMDSTERILENISFNDYADFQTFVKNADFNYKSENEKLLDQIENNLGENDSANIKVEVAALKEKIADEKSMAYDNFKDQIINLIEIQIATRLHLQKGKVYQKLKNDAEIREAIDILKSEERYQKLLQ